MIVTIYEGYDDGYVLLGSKDERFHQAWGNVVRVSNKNLYRNLTEIATWVNNDLGEECLFEVD
ncbi:MAG: hypothetical protein IJI45_18395 [Anaerolineaceae bacterium]|nr:hypothetical protein [Anaerolineaceae bacterium]